MKSEYVDVCSSIIETYVVKLDPPKRARKVDIKDIIQGILIILQDSMSWRRLRPQHGKHQIYYHYFRRWTKRGIFKRVEADMKAAYVAGKLANAGDFKLVSTDTSLIKNRLGCDCVGKNPCDRGRKGNKVAVLCDDNKVPLSVLVYPANMADQRTVIPLVDNLSVDLRRDKRTKVTIIADKGYTATTDMQAALAPFHTKLLASKRRARGSTIEPAISKQDKAKLKDRYKVENFNCRFKQFKRLDKRHERKISNFLSFFSIMSCFVIYERGSQFMSTFLSKFTSKQRKNTV